MLASDGLVKFGKSMLGTPYFYGAKISEGPLTEDKMQRMNKLYPTLVSADYIKKARAQGQVGKINVDCSGLIAGYRGKNIGSAQLYQQAYTRLPIGTIKDYSAGVVLWKKGHVGIYAGIINGTPICYEAKGIQYGTIMSKVSDTKWVCGLTFSDISYTYQNKVEGTWKGTNPYKEPVTAVTNQEQAKLNGIITYTSSGEGVKWVQWELKESGSSISIDGICGPLTIAALIEFQQSCKIVPDGIAGNETRRYLKNN